MSYEVLCVCLGLQPCLNRNRRWLDEKPQQPTGFSTRILLHLFVGKNMPLLGGGKFPKHASLEKTSKIQAQQSWSVCLARQIGSVCLFCRTIRDPVEVDTSDWSFFSKNPWTLQWKGLNLYSRGQGPQNSHSWGVRILRVVIDNHPSTLSQNLL